MLAMNHGSFLISKEAFSNVLLCGILQTTQGMVSKSPREILTESKNVCILACTSPKSAVLHIYSLFNTPRCDEVPAHGVHLPPSLSVPRSGGESFISTPLCHVAKCISFVMHAGVTKVEMFLLI